MSANRCLRCKKLKRRNELETVYSAEHPEGEKQCKEDRFCWPRKDKFFYENK